MKIMRIVCSLLMIVCAAVTWGVGERLHPSSGILFGICFLLDTLSRRTA